MPFFIKNSPGRDTQRTKNRLTLHIPIYLTFNCSNALEIIEGNALYGISTSNRITKALLKRHKPVVYKPNPLTIALKYDRIYHSLSVKSMKNVAQQFGVTHVRVHQMLNLLTIDKCIIKHLSHLTDPKTINYWTERRLRELTRLPEESQYNEFKKNYREFLRMLKDRVQSRTYHNL